MKIPSLMTRPSYYEASLDRGGKAGFELTCCRESLRIACRTIGIPVFVSSEKGNYMEVVLVAVNDGDNVLLVDRREQF